MKEYVVVEGATQDAIEHAINQQAQNYELFSFTVVPVPIPGSGTNRSYVAVMIRTARPDVTAISSP
jgi:hypothetical protein